MGARADMARFDRAALGASLRAAREARGLSVGELAEREGVEEHDLAEWERGDALPSAARLIGLAAALETDLDALVGRDGAARLGEIAAESRRELKATYAALSLGWLVVLALEVARALAPGSSFLAAYLALLVASAPLSVRALLLERDAGLRTARGVTDYLERGARPADEERALSVVGYLLQAVALVTLLEVALGLLGA